MRPREAGTEYFVDHGVAGFYIVTNMDNASGYKIVLQREGARTGEWATFYTPTDGAAIEDMDLFSGHCVVYVAYSAASGRMYPGCCRWDKPPFRLK